MSAEMVKTARSRVLTGGAASFGSPESRATPSWCRCQRQSPKDLYRKKHRSKSIHRFSRETGHDFSNGLSFNYKETSVIVSLKLKLTTKKCYVLSEKIFFEFRISNFMIYRTIPCLILPRWHRCNSDYARARRKRTNIYTFATATRKTVTNYHARWPRD